MTGAIERAEIGAQSIEGKIVQTGIILVNLQHLTDFDPDVFNKLAREITFGFLYMKHIVAEDVMWVFPTNFTHSWMAKAIREQSLSGSFQCAGDVKNLSENGQMVREISGYSDSMAKVGLLRVRDSELYKRIQLQCLAPWFRIRP